MQPGRQCLCGEGSSHLVSADPRRPSKCSGPKCGGRNATKLVKLLVVVRRSRRRPRHFRFPGNFSASTRKRHNLVSQPDLLCSAGSNEARRNDTAFTLSLRQFSLFKPHPDQHRHYSTVCTAQDHYIASSVLCRCAFAQSAKKLQVAMGESATAAPPKSCPFQNPSALFTDLSNL